MAHGWDEISAARTLASHTSDCLCVRHFPSNIQILNMRAWRAAFALDITKELPARFTCSEASHIITFFTPAYGALANVWCLDWAKPGEQRRICDGLNVPTASTSR